MKIINQKNKRPKKPNDYDFSNVIKWFNLVKSDKFMSVFAFDLNKRRNIFLIIDKLIQAIEVKSYWLFVRKEDENIGNLNEINFRNEIGR